MKRIDSRLNLRDCCAQVQWVLWVILVCVLAVVPVQSQGEPLWEVVDVRFSQGSVSPFYQVDSHGHVAKSEVYLDIVSVPGIIDFEFPFTVAISPWLDETLVF